MENVNNCGCDRCYHQLCTKKVPIFSSLEANELDAITELIIHKTYSKGEHIMMEGDKLEGLTIVNSGLLKAYKYSQEGKEQILYVFSPGDFFGEKNLLKDQEASYSVEALEDTFLCRIHKNDFRDLLMEHPAIGLKVIEALSNRIEVLESAIETMGTKSVEGRVNLVLLEFAKKYGVMSEKGITFEMPLSREGIANYIGVTRETISRKLSILQEEGIIELVGHKKIILHQKEMLERM